MWHLGQLRPHWGLLALGLTGASRPRLGVASPAGAPLVFHQLFNVRVLQTSHLVNWQEIVVSLFPKFSEVAPHCRAIKPLEKMAGSCGQEQTRWITTVIMSTSLQDHEISAVLQRQQHRVRYSESVETGSVIFPLSGIAFILSDTQDLLKTGEEEFSKRIQKFINIHRNSFLVLSAALHGPEEWSVMFRIQRRFLGSNLRVIPVHNSAEIVKLMLTMAKITSKSQADDTRCKMEMTKAQIMEKSPVWKMLQEYQSHCN